MRGVTVEDDAVTCNVTVSNTIRAPKTTCWTRLTGPGPWTFFSTWPKVSGTGARVASGTAACRVTASSLTATSPSRPAETLRWKGLIPALAWADIATMIARLRW